MNACVSDVLASVLRSGRDEFNARFQVARRARSDLDAHGFAEFLRTAVDPLAQAVSRVQPQRVAEVVMVAYDIALDLVGHKLVGPGARSGCIEAGWQRLLPQAAAWVSTAPGQVLAAVSNALHQLETTTGARPGEWLDRVEAVLPQCPDLDTFLRAGQVAAWRSGLAHYRSGALAAADRLPEAMVLALLGVAAPARWPELREPLAASPWFDPSSPSPQPPGVRVVAQAGSFRGFGGLFPEPPRVAPAGEHFLVASGDQFWLLTADAFGATFHRATREEFEAAGRRPPLPPELQVTGSTVQFQGNRYRIPAAGEFTSAAANATTLALTSALTHAVMLMALR